MSRLRDVERALSWAHQHGYSFARAAILEYCDAHNVRAWDHWEGFVTFTGPDDGGPNFTTEIKRDES